MARKKNNMKAQTAFSLYFVGLETVSSYPLHKVWHLESIKSRTRVWQVSAEARLPVFYFFFLFFLVKTVVNFLLPCFQTGCFVSAALTNDTVWNICKHIFCSKCQRIAFFFTNNENRSVVAFVSLSLFCIFLCPFFLGSLFPLTLCFALLCHLSLLRLLLCVTCQVLDIIYDLVLCPDCETPDKTSISATNTYSLGSLLHPPLSHCAVSSKSAVPSGAHVHV